MFYLHLIHYIGFFGAQTFNTILAILIVKRAGKLFGEYRHVMLVFTLCSMWFSYVEIVTQPVMYLKESMLVVIIEHGGFSNEIGGLVLCLHCSSFAFLISVFAAQFFYRYAVLCKLKILAYLTGKRIFLIFVPCLLVYITWFLVVYFGMSATPVKRDFLREDLEKKFHLNPETTPIVGPLYWRRDPVSGEKIWMTLDLTTSMMYVVIIGTVSSMILYFAVKIYYHMNAAGVNMSQKTVDLNRQLFVMLTVQTIVPFILMYIPVGFILGFPFFGWSLWNYENCASASIAIYPMIEPLIAMYCITDFRRTLLSITGLKSYGVSRISAVSDVAASIQ